jgi:hypothetical protein
LIVFISQQPEKSALDKTFPLPQLPLSTIENTATRPKSKYLFVVNGFNFSCQLQPVFDFPMVEFNPTKFSDA